MTTYKVGYLIGSLAKGSINRKLANARQQDLGEILSIGAQN